MEARAIKRYIQSSPRKMRLVVDLIRGKAVSDALNILHFSPKHGSKVVEMTLRSAVSNLSNTSTNLSASAAVHYCATPSSGDRHWDFWARSWTSWFLSGTYANWSPPATKS